MSALNTPMPGMLVAFEGLEAPAEELVVPQTTSITTPASAASTQRVAARLEVVADATWPAVLAAAGKEDVDGGRIEGIADADLDDLGVEPAPLHSLAERQDVAAVAVDVHLDRDTDGRW